jgi:LPXTG-motif cell wall-anchored protein
MPATPLTDWRRPLLLAAAAAVALLTLAWLAAGHAAPAAAQGTLQLAITKQLQGSDLVRLNQELTFTIRITNTGTISVVKLPLFDEYDRTILAPVRAAPPASTVDSAAGTLTWDDVITRTPSLGGALRPGQSVAVVAVFRVIRANVATVNRARIGDALGAGGERQGGGGGEGQAGPRGGRVIVAKNLAPGQSPQVGRPLTYTISLTNDGVGDITRLPLDDTFLPAFLTFARAEPPPTRVQTTTGAIRWDDLLAALGRARLAPGETLTVTAVFTAAQTADGQVLNRAASQGARDEYGNDLPEERRAEVPIRIIAAPEQPTPTPTRQPPRRSPPAETPTPPATPTAIITPTDTLTSTGGITPTAAIPTPTATTPAGLPRTGGDRQSAGWLLAGAALLLGGALMARQAASRGRRMPDG